MPSNASLDLHARLNCVSNPFLLPHPMLVSSQISIRVGRLQLFASTQDTGLCFVHFQRHNVPIRLEGVACILAARSASPALQDKDLISNMIRPNLGVQLDDGLNKRKENITTEETFWRVEGSGNPVWVQLQLPDWDQVGALTDRWAALQCPGNCNEKCTIQSGKTLDKRQLNQVLEAVDAVEKQGAFVPFNILSQLVQLCIKEKNLAVGRQVHGLIVGSGYEADIFLGSCLVHMFAVFGSLLEANQVFCKLPKPNAFSWCAIIQAHANLGQNEQAIKLYYQMEKSSLEPDGHIFVAVLKACSSISMLEHGKHIHTCILESGLELDVIVGSTLVSMYAKCGNLNEAYLVFDKLPMRNVVTWSALIAGYVEHGHAKDALQLFKQMQLEDIEPNEVTFLCLLKACSSIAALDHGKCIHLHIVEKGVESHLYVGNTLIDMYSKCGSLENAHIVFSRMPEQDVVTWSALIAGYALHSDYKLASQRFEDMQQRGVKPNRVTYLCLLSACSHAGLINEGCLYFKLMRETPGIVPTQEHYNSIVDLLAKAGFLNEAEELIQILPSGSGIVGWMSLLDSCRMHGNVDLGRRCFDHISKLENQNALAYVLMSNIYAHAGMWEDVTKIRELRRCANVWKKPAKAFIEIDNQVHDFIVGDISHPRSVDIYAKLKTLSTQIREEGHIPCFDLSEQSISNEDKEDSLCGHCEKLAIAFGLICTPQGTTIRVAKNLRVCANCHEFVKIISKIELREIIITDAYCIHHFKDGACCCRD